MYNDRDVTEEWHVQAENGGILYKNTWRVQSGKRKRKVHT